MAKNCKYEANRIRMTLNNPNKGQWTGENAPYWKGDNVGIDQLHWWVRKHKPKPDACEACKIKPPYDLANIGGIYNRDPNSYQWLCRSCHMKSDGRMKNLRQYRNV